MEEHLTWVLSKNVRKQDVRTQDFFRCGGSFPKEFYQNQLETQKKLMKLWKLNGWTHNLSKNVRKQDVRTQDVR